jgi:dolichol-phosphate mannosyltransferase
MNKTFASLVLYVRNEQGTVAETLARLGDFLRAHFELYELVVVDDASDDATLERARAEAVRGRHPVTVVQLARRHGVEAGMQAALERAVGDWVFELESSAVDFELSLLEQMYEQASEGFEIVTAAGDEGSRRSRLFYGVVNRYADLEHPLRTVRVRLTSRRSLNAMLTMKEKVRYRKALYAFVGARQHHLIYEPVPSESARRVAHRLDREKTSLAFDVLLSFSGFGLRLAHRLSFGFGLVSVLALAYAVFVYLFQENVVQGWTTVTVIASTGFAGVFLVLGLLGEYLARILIEVRARPLYSVRAADVVVPTGSTEDKPEPTFMLEQRDLSAPAPARDGSATDALP